MPKKNWQNLCSTQVFISFLHHNFKIWVSVTKSVTKSFSDDNQLSIENCALQNDESQNLCQICKKSFKQIGNLKRHIKNIHEKNSGYACPYCEKIYDSKEELISHKNSEHLLHQCGLCEKSFKFSHALTRHIRQIHKGGEGVRKYTCGFCGWLFYEKTKV